MNSFTSFIFDSILLGVGLAMDAFSVSMANGLNMPKMSRRMRLSIPLTFAGFQFMIEGGRCQQMAVIGLFLSMANRAAPILPARGNYIRLLDIICMRNVLRQCRAPAVESAEKVPSPHEQIYIEA